MLWQADRRDKIAGRVGVGDAFVQQGAQMPASLLSALTHQPMRVMRHGAFQRLDALTFAGMPVLSPTMLCLFLHIGASSASAITSDVLEDVATVDRSSAALAASAAAFALDMAPPRAHVSAPKKFPELQFAA